MSDHRFVLLFPPLCVTICVFWFYVFVRVCMCLEMCVCVFLAELVKKGFRREGAELPRCWSGGLGIWGLGSSHGLPPAPSWDAVFPVQLSLRTAMRQPPGAFVWIQLPSINGNGVSRSGHILDEGWGGSGKQYQYYYTTDIADISVQIDDKRPFIQNHYTRNDSKASSRIFGLVRS